MARASLDEEEAGYSWLNAYEKTWETLHEDDSGSLESSVANYVYLAKRKRLLERKPNVRLGIMRHVYIVIDMSNAMNEKDLQPTRHHSTLKLLTNFIDEFFDQNPISQLGFIVTKDKRAENVSEMSGNSMKLKESLKTLTDALCVGEPSLQNSFELALKTLKRLPSHTSREIIVIFGSLSSCDPSNVYVTIDMLKAHKVRCSVIGLAAEVRLCKVVCNETGGQYNVVLDETHFKDLLAAQTLPPPAVVNNEQFFLNLTCKEIRFLTNLKEEKDLDSKLVRMGFPEHRLQSTTELTLCSCDTESNAFGKKCSHGGYFCPQCKSKYCTLPVDCKICGLTLVSAPHLARSYHHLFPVMAYTEVPMDDSNATCYSCLRLLEHKMYVCEKCQKKFCIDCDLFVHETLHTCPGC